MDQQISARTIDEAVSRLRQEYGTAPDVLAAIKAVEDAYNRGDRDIYSAFLGTRISIH